MADERTNPTMVIPQGTEISVNDKGQLAIRTPGNLVIQNPGTYSVIECGNGSIRIDAGVKVEAATVQVADTCCVAGTLTAWQVRAKKIILEKGSQAFIMLLQAETLELDRQARLVGNFGSEKELYLMMGRFSQQLRDLPQSLTAGVAPAGELTGGNGPERLVEAAAPPPPNAEEAFEAPHITQQDAEVLALLRTVLQREFIRPDISVETRQELNRLLVMVRSGDVPGVEAAYRRVLSRIDPPSDEVRDALDRLDRFFGARELWAEDQPVG